MAVESQLKEASQILKRLFTLNIPNIIGFKIPGILNQKFMAGNLDVSIYPINVTSVSIDETKDILLKPLDINQIQIDLIPLKIILEANYTYVDFAGTTNGLMTVNASSLTLKANITTYNKT